MELPSVKDVVDHVWAVLAGIAGVFIGAAKVKKSIAADSAETSGHAAYEGIINSLRAETTRLHLYCAQLEKQVQLLSAEITQLRASLGLNNGRQEDSCAD